MADRVILLLFGFAVLVCVAAYPYSDDPRALKQEHCIPVTKKREAEIQQIVNKISTFVDNLALQHEYFDIRLMKFAIERHTPDETEEKDVEIQVTINDCPQNVTITSVANTDTGNPPVANQDTSDPSVANQDTEDPYVANPDATENANTDTTNENDIVPSVKPIVVPLGLDRKGQALLHRIEKKRGKYNPLLVYMQSGKHYIFLRK